MSHPLRWPVGSVVGPYRITARPRSVYETPHLLVTCIYCGAEREIAMGNLRKAAERLVVLAEKGLPPGCSKCSPLPRWARSSGSRDALRSARVHAVRPRSEQPHRWSRRRLLEEAALYPERDYWRPRHRCDCERGPRPCLYVACRYNLFLDVNADTGSIKYNFPDLEACEMAESCALDVADRGPQSLESVGALLNVTRTRVQQLEEIIRQKATEATELLRRDVSA